MTQKRLKGSLGLVLLLIISRIKPPKNTKRQEMIRLSMLKQSYLCLNESSERTDGPWR